MTPTITLTLSADDVQKIINALAKEPYIQVQGLIPVIISQANAAAQPPEASELPAED